jgi:hypothetical protein
MYVRMCSEHISLYTHMYVRMCSVRINVYTHTCENVFSANSCTHAHMYVRMYSVQINAYTRVCVCAECIESKIVMTKDIRSRDMLCVCLCMSIPMPDMDLQKSGAYRA